MSLNLGEGPKKLWSAYSKKLAFYYDFKIWKGKCIAKFHPWKRIHFLDMWEIEIPEKGLKSFGVSKIHTHFQTRRCSYNFPTGFVVA